MYSSSVFDCQLNNDHDTLVVSKFITDAHGLLSAHYHSCTCASLQNLAQIKSV